MPTQPGNPFVAWTRYEAPKGSVGSVVGPIGLFPPSCAKYTLLGRKATIRLLPKNSLIEWECRQYNEGINSYRSGARRMIYLGKNEDRYQAVRDAMNDLNPVIRGVIIIKPDLPGRDVGAGGYTQISFVRAAVDWIRERGNPRRILIAESAVDGTTGELFRSLGYEEFVKNLKNGKNIELFDCNQDQGYEIDFVDSRGETLRLPVSRTILDADCILSLSLLKTHDHVVIAGAIRNLEGFVVGAENKVKLHGVGGKRPHEMNDGELNRSAKAYAQNLLTLYQTLEPDVCIVDGNGQEGNGPLRGTPKTTDLVLTADDALKADVISARIMGISPEDVPYIKLAEEMGLEPFSELDVRGLDPEDVRVDFAPHKRTKFMQLSAV